jgi:hypothetical protein
MAQTGYTPISIYYSATASNTPTAGNLVAGELAINTADGKLFYKDSSGVVQVIAGKGGAGVAGGSNTQVQYNSSGSLAGSANMTFSGTALTLANDAYISGLTVGKGGGSVSNNAVLGAGALPVNTTGDRNIAIGSSSLAANTTGNDNMSIGVLTMATNTTGNNNTAAGRAALYANTSGANNTAIGMQSLQANTTASNNTAVGYQAGYSNTTGTQSTYIGNQAGYLNSGGGFNTAIGCYALNGTGTSTGQECVAVGQSALYSNSTGSYNVAVGRQSLQANTTASNNTAVGYQALYNNTTGTRMTSVGGLSGSTNTAGNYCVYVGYAAGQASTGSGNTFVGDSAGSACTGSNNVFVGPNNASAACGSAVTTGSKNSILGGYSGNQGGLDIRTSNNYCVISDGDGNPRAYWDNNGYMVSIGVYNNTTASAANVFVASNGYVLRSTSALKYKQDIRNLESIDINKFRPVRYKSKAEMDDQTKDHFGIIADEVDEAGITELVNYGADGEVEGFQYERLTVVLLKELQTLKADFEAYKASHP